MVYTTCLLSNLRLRILENYKILEKSQTPENDNPVPIPPVKSENFANASKIVQKNSNKTFPVVRYLPWKLELVSDIL